MYSPSFPRLILTALLLGTGLFSFPLAAAAPKAQQGNHAPAAIAAKQSTQGHYITVGEMPALPAPSAPKSRAHRKDIQQIIGVQAYAAPEEIAAARDEQYLRPLHMVPALGKNVAVTELPLTFALLDRVGADVNAVVGAAKKRWRTTRPYRLDQRVKLLVDPLAADNYGYPSGHAATSAVWAQILAGISPSAATRLQLQADRIAWHRVLAGVHTTEDIAGGKKLAAMIVAALKTKPAFQNDLAAARAEYDAKYSAPAPSGRKNWKSFKSRVTR